MARKVLAPVRNIDAALRAYYGCGGYIDSKVIKEIFGISDSTVWKMKRDVREEEALRNVPIVVPYHVNVKVAFDVWGIDVKELERCRKKIAELAL